MVGIPSFLSRGTSGAKPNPAADALPANGSKPGAPANGQHHRPGQDSPDDIAGNQLPPGKQKTTTGDKLGMAANVAMAGSMVIPMLPMGGGDKKKAEGQKPPGHKDEGPHIEDPALYKENQVRTSVGPPQINW